MNPILPLSAAVLAAKVNYGVDAIESFLGGFPQVVAPLTHRFTPGLYTREIHMLAGSLIVSKIHNTEHPFVISKGVVSVWTEADGIVKLSAPHTGITKPGTRRILYVHEDTTWLTFHPTNETSVDKIEEQIIQKHTPQPIGKTTMETIMKMMTGDQKMSLCLKRARKLVESRRAKSPKGFDPKNTWVNVGIAAVSVGAGTYGSVSAAGAAHDAQNQNTMAVQNANANNLLNSLYTRGIPMSAANSYGIAAGGVAPSARGVAAAVLPYYFGKGGESGLALDTLSNYKAENAYTGTPGQALSRYADIVKQYQVSQQQADQAGSNLFNGNLESTLLSQAQPVWDQNIQGAQSQIQAGFQALAKTLSDIDAIQAKKGFTGDTSGNNLLKFAARQNIGQEGAAGLNAAKMENARAKESIQGGILQQQLQNISLPTSQASAAIGRYQMPLNSLSQESQNKQAPFAFFKMLQNQFQPVVTPVQGAIPSAGQIIGSNVGGLATGLGNIYQQYKQNQETNSMLSNYLNSNAWNTNQNAWVNSVNNMPQNPPPSSDYAPTGG